MAPSMPDMCATDREQITEAVPRRAGGLCVRRLLAYAACAAAVADGTRKGEDMRGVPLIIVIWSLLLGSAHARTEWLAGMPDAQQIQSAVKGRSERDTAAQTSAALQMMEGIVQSLSPKPFDPARLAPDVKERLAAYRALQQQVDARETARFASKHCEGEHCEKYLYPKCQAKYQFSAEFYRVVLDRHFSPEWQRQWVPKVHGTLWQRALRLPPGTALAADFGAGVPCSGLVSGADYSEPGLMDYAELGADMGLEAFASLLVGDNRTRRKPRDMLDGMGPGLLLAAGAAVVLVLFALRQNLRRVRLDPADPRKLDASVPHDFELFSGDVQSYSRGIETITTVSGGQNNTPVTSSTRSVLHERFFLVGPVGGELEVKLTDRDSGVRDGHRMSVAWISKPGSKSQYWLFMRNHSTGRTLWFDDSAKRPYGMRTSPVWLLLALFIGVGGWIAARAQRILLTDGWDVFGHLLVAFGLPVLAVAILLYALMRGARSRCLRLFRRDIEERLIPQLDRGAGMARD